MTHMSDVTNGASLEDSHTNFFALADLNQSNGMNQSNGINWLRLCADNVLCFDPLDDPVLSSYSKCLSAGLLCVWRQVVVQKPNYHAQNYLNENNRFSHSKELWIFWYGEEPDLNGLVGPNLREAEQGSWESGLSYECRVLLFKALHNLIEKCLLSKGFTRLGRFFVEPQALSRGASRSQIAFAFSFFVHGESTVCTSVDIRVAPSVYHLKKCHLQAAAAGDHNVKVILSPYGMEGTLTGQAYRQNDISISKLLAEWYSFYPRPAKRGNEDADMPVMVEVLVGGVRMKYPTGYVFVVDQASVSSCDRYDTNRFCPSALYSSSTTSNFKSNPSLTLLTPPTSPERSGNNPQRARTQKNKNAMFWNRSADYETGRNAPVPSVVKLSVNEEVRIAHPNEGDDANSMWDFQDPGTISKCGCSRKQNFPPSKGSAHSSHNEQTHSSRTVKNEKSHSASGFVPFHQRMSNTDIVLDVNSASREDMSSSLEASSSANHAYDGSQIKNYSVNPTMVKTECGLVALPQLHTPLTQPSSVDSHSNIPSVEANCTPICSSDPIMPTLSPHPKTENHVTFTHSPDADIGATINIKEENMPNEILMTIRSSSLLAYFENNESPETPGKNQKTENDLAKSSSGVAPSAGTDSQGLKRPVLPSSNHDNSELENKTMSGVLYDYSAFDSISWSEPPLRKRRLESSDRISDSKMDDIYEITLDSNDSSSPYATSSFTPKDPYEFIDIDEGTPSEGFRQHVDVRTKEDEQSNTPVSAASPEDMLVVNTSLNDAKNPSVEHKPVTSPSKNAQPKFIREEDLTVSVHDLDNIFDTSSSENEEMFSGPADMMKTSGMMNDSLTSKNANAATGLLELSRMYPTPPSLEQNAGQSPLGLNSMTEKLLYDESGMEKTSECIYMQFCADSRDSSSVWKPLEYQIVLESERYSSLNGLSNPVQLPPDYLYKPSPKGIHNLGLERHFENHLGEQQLEFMQHQSRYMVDEDDQMYNPGYSIDPNIDQRFSSVVIDLQSPASNASSYTNKHLNSVGDGNMLPPIPEAHGLFVNLLLSDSMLNLFKDHNFDSCALCICNMNIRGADVGVNLPHFLLPYETDEPQYRCTCGFSAVVYRHRSYCAGLFYEDEFDITGFRMDDLILSKYSNSDLSSLAEPKREFDNRTIIPDLVDYIKVQCKSLCSSFSIFQKPDLHFRLNSPPQVNALEIRDMSEVCFSALDIGKNIMDNAINSKLDESLKSTCLHRWPHSNDPLPCTSKEIMLRLDTLKPMLQEAVHKRNTQRLWEVTYVVEGPLTWREFHRLAARGTEDQCEPQPIPSVTVGYDKDYLSMSPFALKYWDKLLLEPFSMSRDVAYVVVAPDNDYILNHVMLFFQELSSMYALLKMGRHSPITMGLRDGIMRVGKKVAAKLANEPIDDWFNHIGDSPIANKIKLYARVCRHYLAPFLSTVRLNKGMFENSSMKSEKLLSAANSPMPSSQESSEQNKLAESSSESLTDGNSTSHGTSGSAESTEDEDQISPAIVIYIVEPFSFASVDPSHYRTVTLGLLHSYSQMLDYLPDSVKNSISLQLISLDSLLCLDKSSNGIKWKDELKCLAFSVFSQCHRLLPRQLSVKSLTGFGPAAAQDTFLNANKKLYMPTSIFSQPLVLASLKDKQTELGEMFGDGQEKSGTLYCSYCLTEDKKWLLASCTNNNGELMEMTIINIGTPNRSRRKCAAVRRRGLTKLLDFILQVLSNSTHPWRIIIGRLGRLGHGELRDWSALLSRKSLLSYSRHLGELCKQCSGLGPGDMPSILSACLISLEPDPVLRIMPDQYTPEVHDSNNVYNTCHLSTPEDASCTHILVFPTSATMQASQATSHQEHIDSLPGGVGDDDFFEALTDDDIIVGQDINDIFKWSESPAACQSNSPHIDSISHVNSPNAAGFNSPFQSAGPNRNSYNTADCLDEPLQLLQQPLALGYYVSTAKTGHLPNWFWSSCPHLANRLPVFLKFALLIHLPSIQQNSDDILHANPAHQNCHPLDSNYTTDVLRYVLEGYNALSWLSLDPSSHDRRSCLPVHIQLLMQLYRIVENLL